MHGVRAKFYTGSVPSGQSFLDSEFVAVRYNFVGGGNPVDDPAARRCYDTDGYHRHLTDTNLTGTVSKTASDATITGSGTSFTTELEIGDAVRIPGGTPYAYRSAPYDVVVVESITDNTHFEAKRAPVWSASGQTAFLDSSAFVVQAGLAGYYAGEAMANFRSDDSGVREVHVVYNGWDAGHDPAGSNNHVDENAYDAPNTTGEQASVIPFGPVWLSDLDLVQVYVFQDAGGTLGMAADLVGYPFTMWRVAV